MKDQKLQELSQTIGSLKEEVRAAMDNMPSDPHKDMMEKVYRICDAIYSYVDNVASSLYKHTDPSSHIPPIKGAGQMNKVLKTLGMSDDYEVKPKIIYASKNNITIEAEYKP